MVKAIPTELYQPVVFVVVELYLRHNVRCVRLVNTSRQWAARHARIVLLDPVVQQAQTHPRTVFAKALSTLEKMAGRVSAALAIS